MLLALALILTLTGCAKPAAFAPAQTPVFTAAQQLRADISALLGQPGLRRASWGIAVESLSTGDRLFDTNPELLLVPGSTVKIITAATAAASVGWDYTFTTSAAITGPVDAGVLRGDLVVTGTGDPSIEGRGGTGFFGPLLAALRQRQITRIEGRVIGNDNLVEEPRPGLAWSWDDLGVPTGAVAGALNLAENTTRVHVLPGTSIGAPTKLMVAPDVTDLPIINRSITGSPGSSGGVWAEQRPGDAGLTIAGTISIAGPPTPLTVAVGNPTLWVARVLRSRLITSGIDVQGAAVDIDDVAEPLGAGELIVAHRSPPLRDLVAPMLKHSINMYADAVLRLATGPTGPRVIADAVAAQRRQLRAWAIADDAIQVVDGSGLSRFDVVTARALVAVLKQIHEDGGSAPTVQALPVAGVDGTLENRMKATPAAGNARAKTGSMTHVRSLAGYVTTRDGETLAFAIIANNFEAGSVPVTAAIDQIVVRLAEFSRR